jgi:hypothetical protein
VILHSAATQDVVGSWWLLAIVSAEPALLRQPQLRQPSGLSTNWCCPATWSLFQQYISTLTTFAVTEDAHCETTDGKHLGLGTWPLEADLLPTCARMPVQAFPGLAPSAQNTCFNPSIAQFVGSCHTTERCCQRQGAVDSWSAPDLTRDTSATLCGPKKGFRAL